MVVGEYSILSAIRRMDTFSYPSRTNSSLAASRISCRKYFFCRALRSFTPIAIHHSHLLNDVNLKPTCFCLSSVCLSPGSPSLLKQFSLYYLCNYSTHSSILRLSSKETATTRCSAIAIEPEQHSLFRLRRPMPQDTADIVGSAGANFTVTISAATIKNAVLEVPDEPDQTLKIIGSREVAIPQLPKADSQVRLDLVWGPADPDAIIDVGTVTSGTATAATPKGRIDRGKTPGYVLLFGLRGQ